MSDFQDNTDEMAGEGKKEEIGDLDDILRREREMESEPIDAEVYYSVIMLINLLHYWIVDCWIWWDCDQCWKTNSLQDWYGVPQWSLSSTQF